jgi:hypothetical protein
MHLEVAADVRAGDHPARGAAAQRLLHGERAQEMFPHPAALEDAGRLRRTGHRILHRLRPARLDQFRDDPRARRADELDVAQRPGGDSLGHRQRKRNDRLCCALVAELAAFGRLQRGHVVQKRGRPDVDVVETGGLVSSAPTLLCNHVHTPGSTAAISTRARHRFLP